jgi:hypothetical protein
MRRKTSLVTGGLRSIAAVGVALVVLLGLGALGGVNAAHSSCGTYCWNVYAPFNPTGPSWSTSGNAPYQWNAGPYAQSNGQMIDSQQSSASNQWGGLTTYLVIQGDTINFHTEVGVTYTFTVLVEAAYSDTGWCSLPFGSYGAISQLTVVAGLVGTSYSTSNQVINAEQASECDILVPHGGGVSPALTPSPMRSGGYGGYVTLTLAIWIPSGLYTPYVELIAYTYADAQLLAGCTASLNVGSGGYYAQWTNLNVNWGPGEG